MARIVVIPGPIVATALLQLASNVIAVSQQTARLKAVADQITNNGAVKALLETSAESQFPVGSGTALYDGIAQINTALAGLATLVSAIDQSITK